MDLNNQQGISLRALMNPEENMSPSEVLMSRLQRAQMQGLDAQQKQIQNTQGRLKSLEGQKGPRDLTGLAMLADMFNPGSNYTGMYQQFKQPSFDQQRAALNSQLAKQNQTLANQAGSMLQAQRQMAKPDDAMALENLRSQNRKDYLDHQYSLQKRLTSHKNAMKSSEKKSKPKSFNRDQTNAATFGRRLEQANIVFDDLENSGYNRADRYESMRSILPKEFHGENLRRQEQAERNFVNAVLRRESGAAIADSEFKSAEEQYFPRPGDTSGALEQKRANRQQAIEGLRVGAGEAWDAVPLVNPLKGATKKSNSEEKDAFSTLEKELGL